MDGEIVFAEVQQVIGKTGKLTMLIQNLAFVLESVEGWKGVVKRMVELEAVGSDGGCKLFHSFYSCIARPVCFVIYC